MVWSVVMDLSPMQSGSKCNSDFSIERILSDDSKREEAEVPSWLCCTRYQPPRIPRPSSSGQRARRSGRHARVPFTAAQAAALEAAYSRAPYLAPPALKALAASLQLRDDRIKIWFQNRRARERRERNTTITPPHAVTLPATRLPGLPEHTPATSSWLPQSTGSSSTGQNTMNLTELVATQLYEDRHRSAVRICLPVDHNDSFSEESNDNEHRPETPLDIET